MYKLFIKYCGTDREEVKEFSSAKLAILYRDYHLEFGQWNNKSRWIDEKDLTDELRVFIIDEMTELRDNKIVRLLKVSDGIELKLEKAYGNTIIECSQFL